MNFLCPICGQVLSREGQRVLCPQGHSFDIARQGYVNLLPVQRKHSRNPGDTREQVLSRREFLETGTYGPILQALVEAAQQRHIRGPILDVGCGEGYYGAGLGAALGCSLVGLDISKEAVRAAAGKYKDFQWICATAAQIPVEDGAVELLTSLFALTLPEEFARVLKPGGYFFQVVAAQDHLLGLKSIIYEDLHRKEKTVAAQLPGFVLEQSIPIRFSFTIEGKRIQALFAMTPHLFRIGPAGAQRLGQTKVLTDTASCWLNIYRRP